MRRVRKDNVYCCILLVACMYILYVLTRLQSHFSSSRSFEIDYECNEFKKDGKIFKYIAGEMHYFRVPSVYWRDRLRKIKAAGLNAVSTYVFWGAHEPFPNVYDFSGQNDLEYFLQIADEEGLLVLLRPGPYICAEIDFGGLPPWLLTIDPYMKIRSSNATYQKYVAKWFAELMPRMEKFLYKNGGPIILVQVENEFGSFICDRKYTIWVRDLLRNYVKEAAVLYTTDGAGESFFNCGPVPGVFATVDFGILEDSAEKFKIMKKYNNGGPSVNSEFYAGWLVHWNEEFPVTSSELVAKKLDEMLSQGASVSIYMFHGGTNFGFSAGANYKEKSLQSLTGDFQPSATSYDYDAPLNEAGDPTVKYYAIHSVIKKHAAAYSLNVSNNLTIMPSKKGKFGRLKLSPVVSILDLTKDSRSKPLRSKLPLSFEEMQIYQGFVLYETSLPAGLTDSVILSVADIRDYSVVFIDTTFVGILSRMGSRLMLNITLTKETSGNEILRILVENQGHINYGRAQIGDYKGLIPPVKIDDIELKDWTMHNHNMSNIKELQTRQIPHVTNFEFNLPMYFSNKFLVSSDPQDTFLDVSGWGKGVAFINEHNLGRYWPLVGPQIRLYVPASFLKPYPAVNRLTLFELQHAPSNLSVFFVDTPLLNSRTDLSLS